MTHPAHQSQDTSAMHRPQVTWKPEQKIVIKDATLEEVRSLRRDLRVTWIAICVTNALMFGAIFYLMGWPWS